MMAYYLDLSTIRRRIRYAWCRYVLPACASREAPALLAALVVADTSLDELLRAEGHPGRSAGERLWNARLSFGDYESISAARRTRHQAVHHLDYPLCWRAVADALEAYARALWEHGVELGCGHQTADDDQNQTEGSGEVREIVLLELAPIDRARA